MWYDDLGGADTGYCPLADDFTSSNYIQEAYPSASAAYVGSGTRNLNNHFNKNNIALLLSEQLPVLTKYIENAFRTDSRSKCSFSTEYAWSRTASQGATSL